MCSFRRWSEKDTEAAPAAADGSTALRIDEFHKLTLCRCWLLCPRAVLMTDEQPSLGPGWLFSKPGRPLQRARVPMIDYHLGGYGENYRTAETAGQG